MLFYNSTWVPDVFSIAYEFKLNTGYWHNLCECLPIIELLSTPNAQMHGGPFGMVNLQKLQLLEKYLGKKLTVAKLDCLFNFSSSRLNTWTVPWSDVTHKLVLVWLKLIQ